MRRWFVLRHPRARKRHDYSQQHWDNGPLSVESEHCVLLTGISTAFRTVLNTAPERRVQTSAQRPDYEQFLFLTDYDLLFGIVKGDALAGLQRGDRHRSEEHTSELQSLRHLVCR